jgi:hypothetical protein
MGTFRSSKKETIAASDAERWELGPGLRSAGSLHADIWHGTAAELASRETIAVFPVIGWWHEHPQLERAHPVRYSLIVSIETAQTSVDLYAIVESLLSLPASPA